ncbi:MAG: type IX secretion system sortase PorU, partial [Porphyromonadaceae bacterium]|nr:type IX secretion system sortase PorU [Porphyromonadaceae bacterium]
MYVSRLPLWITATCDFSRFDDRTNSGGEELFLNTQGGGIALISTTRVVYIDANGYINKAFIEHLFDKDSEGHTIRLGDVMRLAKNNIGSNANNVQMNKLNYILLGDPALRLLCPSYQVELTHINDTLLTEIDADSLLLKARSWVTVKGEIQSSDAARLTDFNGLIYPRLYDSEREIVTGGNGNDNDEIIPYTFYTRDNLLYTGQDSVRAGEFEFTFKMPLELNYSNEPGLFNLYAYDTQGREAQGVNTHFIIGDLDTDVEEDDEVPIIHYMFLISSDFSNGDKVNETPLFVAQVEDASGINISGIGLGHDMTLCVDGDSKQEYVLNSYFTPVTGEFGLGDVYYELPTLTNGSHTLLFTVWDTEGNSSSQSLNFTVKTGLKPQIYSLYAEKSPATDVARFYIRHDRPGMLMTVKLSVFDWYGREIWTTEQTAMSDMWLSSPIEWDLTDKGGHRVQNGVYLYRAIISVNGSSEATKTQKIMVIPQ